MYRRTAHPCDPLKMSRLIRQLKPEEEEVLRKREELAAIRATLAERELELVDFRSKLAAFEGRYLREVGTLYAELDEWKARIAELQARLHPSDASHKDAEEARQQARQTYEEAHGKASEAPEFKPSPELKRLYREAAKRVQQEDEKSPERNELEAPLGELIVAWSRLMTTRTDRGRTPARPHRYLDALVVGTEPGAMIDKPPEVVAAV